MRLLSRRDRVVWVIAFIAVAALLVAMKFKSHDPDSALYADLSAKLSTQPLNRWTSPEWWGLWPDAHLSGYFIENPAGLFWVPAALGRLGLPPVQGAYVFGIGAGLLALLLAGQLAGRLTSAEEGRALLVLLQIMPLAFVFRIRDNHEYPMLVCLLATLLGLLGVKRSWWWVALVACGFAGGLVIKGAFVALILAAAGLWILVNPGGGSRARPVVAWLVAGAAMFVAAAAYDISYIRITGDSFWLAYWNRQLAPVTVSTPIAQAGTFFRHVAFYLTRLLYQPAPWSLALLWLAWTRGAGPTDRPAVDRSPARRGLVFVLGFTAFAALLLSGVSRFAERYAFSATYLLGAAGAVVAYQSWGWVRQTIRRLDAAIPALPAVTWATLIVLRLALGPWLPKIGG